MRYVSSVSKVWKHRHWVSGLFLTPVSQPGCGDAVGSLYAEKPKKKTKIVPSLLAQQPYPYIFRAGCTCLFFLIVTKFKGLIFFSASSPQRKPPPQDSLCMLQYRSRTSFENTQGLLNCARFTHLFFYPLYQGYCTWIQTVLPQSFLSCVPSGGAFISVVLC